MDPSLPSDHSLRMVRSPCASISCAARRGPRALVACRVVIFVLALCEPAQAFTMRTLTLEDLVTGARTIFVGRCVAVRDVDRGWAGLPVRETEFTVVELMKAGGAAAARPAGQRVGGTGSPTGDRIRMRQIAGPAMPGFAPSFEVGQEVLLFLHGDSGSGLTSPVGLAQGVFTIVRMALGNGADLAVRGYGTPRLTSLGALPQRSAPTGQRGTSMGPAVELESLLDAVRRLVAERR